MSNKDHCGLVDLLLKEGRPWHPFKKDLTEALNNFALSEAFGWTPDEIRNLDEYEKICYFAILRGRSESK